MIYSRASALKNESHPDEEKRETRNEKRTRNYLLYDSLSREMIHRSREVNVDGVDCVVVASYSQSDSSRTPVTVYVNELNNAAMGDYVYAIGQSQTFLHHGTSSESGSGSGSIESLNLLLNKKLQRPVYLNVSGAAQVSTVSMFRAIVEVIDN